MKAPAAKRFRYRAEGPEARAWREIAENVEQNDGVFIWSHDESRRPLRGGLCAGVARRIDTASARELVGLFNDGKGWFYYWPVRDDIRFDGACRTDRILAAWLCYWMAREAGR